MQIFLYWIYWFYTCSKDFNWFCQSKQIPPSDQRQFRSNKINEFKDYFVADIKDKELMSKRLSKYITSFDYFDKSLIVLSVATGRISIASFSTVTGAPAGIASAIFSLALFSISTGIIKNCLKTTRKKEKVQENCSVS